MGVDTFTLITQIINLVILIWLLKKFLYTPILKAVDTRQAKIAERLNTAREQADKAIEQQNIYQEKIVSFEQERQNMFEEARKEAEHIRSALIEEAKEEVIKSRNQWQKELLNEKKAFDDNLKNLLLKQFKIFADQSIKQMAGVSLQSLIENEFKQKLINLSVKEKNLFMKHLSQNKCITILSAVKMSPEQKKDMSLFLLKTLNISDNIRFEFKEDKTLLSGLELQIGEQTISWNMRQYLNQFETNLDAAITGLIQQE